MIEHYQRHLMLTSRITEGENRNWYVTIMEISVCFSWALGPNSTYFNFALAFETVFLKHYCCCRESQKKVKCCHQLLVDDDKNAK